MEECTDIPSDVLNNYSLMADKVIACATESQDVVVDIFEFEGINQNTSISRHSNVDQRTWYSQFLHRCFFLFSLYLRTLIYDDHHKSVFCYVQRPILVRTVGMALRLQATSGRTVPLVPSLSS